MRKRSIILAISAILAAAYSIYLICYFLGGTASADPAEAAGSAVATALVTPHTVMFVIGAIFGWLGLLLRKSWAALTGAILYSVGTLLFLLYAMFGVPILILGFIGYANQKKINKKLSSRTVS